MRIALALVLVGLCAVALWWAFAAQAAPASVPMTELVPATRTRTPVFYPRPESPDDDRHLYHLALIESALERAQEPGERFQLLPAAQVMNELRLFKLLVNARPQLDLLFRPTSIAAEEELTPVRIPLDRGLLGYRLCLIHREDAETFATVAGLDGLRGLRIGQGRDWADVPIYEHAGLEVVTGSDYEGLFEMLVKRRFDCFPRGVNEIFIELDERREALPELSVAEGFALHYPLVRYVWVADSPKGALLRARITAGLEAMLKDGSFERLFWKFHGVAIERAALAERRIIEIASPFLPDSVPVDRPELWFDPLETPTEGG